METGFNGPVFFLHVCNDILLTVSNRLWPEIIRAFLRRCVWLCAASHAKGGDVKLATIWQRFIWVLLYSSLFLLTPFSAYGQDVQGRNWAGACTGCHGTEGRSNGAIPSIAGIEKQKFVRLMMAFRDGSKAATVMHQHARGLNDDQIDKLGDYFSSREPVGGNDK
jgi:cytochrome c553